MAHSTFNIVSEVNTDNVGENNVEMVNVVDGERNSSTVNKNFIRSTSPVATLLQSAANNGGSTFNVFVYSLDSQSLPKRDPRVTQRELQLKLSNPSNLSNVRRTRKGEMLLSTKDVNCAIEIIAITEFLSVGVSTRVIWENITNRFLLFNIPSDVTLKDLAAEITSSNGIDILELRRFVRKDQARDHSPVLITMLGTKIPNDIKLWYSIQTVRPFIDRPRQCSKCFKFNHGPAKCPMNQLCVTCGVIHVGPCTLPVSCANCKGEHRADYLQCPHRAQEAEFLQFKCRNFLSFVEARRLFSQKKPDSSTYARVARESKPELDTLEKFIETRTNAILKILNEVITAHAEKTSESISVLTNLLVKFLAEVNEKSPERRKRTCKGDGKQPPG